MATETKTATVTAKQGAKIETTVTPTTDTDKKKEARRKFVVTGSAIHVANKDDPSKIDKKNVGDVVELTAKEMRHFDKMDRLKPYLGDDASDDEEE